MLGRCGRSEAIMDDRRPAVRRSATGRCVVVDGDVVGAARNANGRSAKRIGGVGVWLDCESVRAVR